MTTRNAIVYKILTMWGYGGLAVGDIDGRNYLVEQAKNKYKRDRTYKRNEAVKHAYRLADIAIESIGV